jgi:phenylacetic acid degradation protein
MKQVLRVYSIDGVTPVVDPTAFVHPSAVLIGDVIVGPGVYVGPCASLRGDFGRLVIREGANIQDCCIVHGFPDADTVIGRNGHIGHGAIIHGAVIGDNALIGMNAVINDYAEIGEAAIVAALAFVKAQDKVPPRSLVAGIPARVLRELTKTELDWKAGGTRLYQNLTLRSLKTMRARAPLTKESAKRKRFTLPAVLPLSVLKKKPPR